ncbi:hypothetical protein MTR67_038552 [Solanum verrucosum]
MDSRV